MIVPVMAISNLVLTQKIYSEETNGAHAHNRDCVPLNTWSTIETPLRVIEWIDSGVRLHFSRTPEGFVLPNQLLSEKRAAFYMAKFVTFWLPALLKNV